ncbi:hypothetical protein HYW19_03880 [Candidatus Woesearchaeota archaeon]|nr:hypothetical protein [Candidatus Woesearchaeota archaeon]
MSKLVLLRMKVCKIIFLLILVIWILPIPGYALPKRIYLNESSSVIIDGSPTHDNYTLSSNLSIEDEINLTFEAQVNSNGKFEVEFTNKNQSNYLLRLRIDDQGGMTPEQQIFRVDCLNESKIPPTPFYNDGNGGLNFAVFNNFSFVFDSSVNKSNIYVGNTNLGQMDICGNVSEVGYISFIWVAQDIEVKSRIVTANNKPPQFIGNLPNITWPENTSIGLNISGNFSDANNDTLTFSLEAAVENISITVNQSTGIVNLTPNSDFFGVRYVRFIANDSDNITFSNNVTLNVTNVNDLPSVTSATISNSDFLNRTNGTLIASWAFDDKDGDVMTGNETLWYINGIENASLRNSTTIGDGNTTKSQNWSFSVRIYDGTGFSNFAYSANLTIQNALQEFSPVLGVGSNVLGVETIERGKLFTYDVNYTDLDNDNITFSDNSTLFNITSEGIINFTPTLPGNITANITMSQNPNVSGILTIDVQDSAAPQITSISASSSGTSTITIALSVTTDETAICNFAAADINFSSMSQMSSTSSTSHSNSQSFTSDASGTYYVRCNDTIGNVMNSSSSAAFNADVQEASSGGDDSGSSGGSGGWQCRYEVQCTGWSECANGKQARSCSNVEVVPFYSSTKCEYLLEQETERECNTEGTRIGEAEGQNNIEEGISVDKAQQESAGSAGSAITGAAIFSGLMGKIKPMSGLISLVIIAAIGIGSFAYFRRPSSELTPEEMEILHKMMEKEYLKSIRREEEQNRLIKP